MKKFLITALVALGSTLACNAQLTILNQPSADVTDKGGIYSRADASYQPSNAVSTLAPNLMFGVGHHTELDLNAENISHPDYQQISVVPGFKTVVWDTVDSIQEVRNVVFLGDKLALPVVNRRYNVGNYFYLADAVSMPSLGRITAGVWNSEHYEDRGNRSGALLGYEVNLSYAKHVVRERGSNNDYVAFRESYRPSTTLAFDWQSGNGYDGGLTAGLMIYPNDRLMIIPAYKIGNRDVGKNNQAMLYVGYRFK